MLVYGSVRLRSMGGRLVITLIEGFLNANWRYQASVLSFLAAKLVSLPAAIMIFIDTDKAAYLVIAYGIFVFSSIILGILDWNLENKKC